MLSSLLPTSIDEAGTEQQQSQQPLAPSCTTRHLDPNREFDLGMKEGVWHASDATWNECVQSMPTGFSQRCGEYRPVNLTTCTSPSHGAESAYTTSWLLGPFNTTGGFDWSIFSFLMTEASFPDSVAIGSYSVRFFEGSPTGALAHTRQLGFPPLHNHHVGVNGGLPHWRTTIIEGKCPNESDGFACSEHDRFSHGLVEMAHGLKAAPLFIRGALVNDVRPADSPPLNWYFNLTIEFVDPKLAAAQRLKPVALLNVHHANRKDSTFGTMDVPTGIASFATYEGTWDASRTIVGDAVGQKTLSWHHSHGEMFQYGFLIAASAAELGLHNPAIRHSLTGCDSASTSEAGFGNNEQLLLYLSGVCPECFSLNAPNSRLLCRVNASRAFVAPYFFDRRGQIECSAPQLKVEKGAPFTSISFFAPKAEPYSPGPIPRKPGIYPMHTSWYLYYHFEEAMNETTANSRGQEALVQDAGRQRLRNLSTEPRYAYLMQPLLVNSHVDADKCSVDPNGWHPSADDPSAGAM